MAQAVVALGVPTAQRAAADAGVTRQGVIQPPWRCSARVISIAADKGSMLEAFCG
ncbi:hypothetical protein [Ottowia caeni]|uniref:hypothetical protein n=1 Tax=Ottowia caeni TaxID=2870339 RepID=UPI003D710079